VGYYGISDNDTFDEDSRPGNDFLAKLCVQWWGVSSFSSVTVNVFSQSPVMSARTAVLR
jgi:NAD dependent epimerase/dehydratase family enzyme